MVWINADGSITSNASPMTPPTERDTLRAENAAKDATIAELTEALAPFVKALDDWGDDQGQPDRWDTSEHPIAYNVTLGDFRRAKLAALASSKERTEHDQ